MRFAVKESAIVVDGPGCFKGILITSAFQEGLLGIASEHELQLAVGLREDPRQC